MRGGGSEHSGLAVIATVFASAFVFNVLIAWNPKVGFSLGAICLIALVWRFSWFVKREAAIIRRGDRIER